MRREALDQTPLRHLFRVPLSSHRRWSRSICPRRRDGGRRHVSGCRLREMQGRRSRDFARWTVGDEAIVWCQGDDMDEGEERGATEDALTAFEKWGKMGKNGETRETDLVWAQRLCASRPLNVGHDT